MNSFYNFLKVFVYFNNGLTLNFAIEFISLCGSSSSYNTNLTPLPNSASNFSFRLFDKMFIPTSMLFPSSV